MGSFNSNMPVCPANQHCSQWARKNMKYCLCNAKDGVSLFLGLVSVISWGVAEVPQIITNYRQKSTEGLSIGFLLTWIIGDLFNLFGCMLEPATLYTFTTMILAGQAVYYGHIYPRLKQRRQEYKGLKPNVTESVETDRLRISNGRVKTEKVAGRWRNGSDASDGGQNLTSPIPLPALPANASPGRGLYYVSARSLSSSHTPPTGSFFTQRMGPSSFHTVTAVEEPLLSGSNPQSAPAPKTKNMLCLVSLVMFIGSFNLLSTKDRVKETYGKPSGTVMQVGRKLLQINGGLFEGIGSIGNAEIGTFLGWAMAAIYMGGRLPQICLNIRRGNVEGLNPLMFVFALVGNATYVARPLNELTHTYGIYVIHVMESSWS
ncbi:hypothetical protein CDL15_Pgr001250 [Punica granatum]|uniref:Uncharacterized protein n=1 Tax=Punica granatum TaxID=22663 RepID=A0A218WKG6_PUNGR|nr:hypothetical protein CDL15_Pgr001250 [Punica granatum]